LKQISDEGQESQKTFDQLRAQAIGQQCILDQLAVIEREKKASIEQLKVEERRLQTVVAELSDNAREAEQVRTDSWSRRENEHKSVVEKLVARELELRGHIDQLEVCLGRLEAKIKRATEEEKECQSRRIECLAPMEKEQQSALESLGPTESQGSRAVEPRQVGPVSTEEQLCSAGSEQGRSKLGRRVGLEELVRTALDSDGEAEEQVEGERQVEGPPGQATAPHEQVDEQPGSSEHHFPQVWNLDNVSCCCA
jgi:hypothetical protein